MAAKFTNTQWQKILLKLEESWQQFSLPQRRADSVVVGSFNIRKLGAVTTRSDHSWQFLKRILERFDLIAIQEVMDDLSGLEHLLSLLGDNYGMVVSDITGAKPGKSGNIERLAFVFNWKRVQRTALASDVTFDRSEIAGILYNNRTTFSKSMLAHAKKLDEWQDKVIEKKALGNV